MDFGISQALDVLIERMIKTEGFKETILFLLEEGVPKKTLITLGFDSGDVEDVAEEMD